MRVTLDNGVSAVERGAKLHRYPTLLQLLRRLRIADRLERSSKQVQSRARRGQKGREGALGREKVLAGRQVLPPSAAHGRKGEAKKNQKNLYNAPCPSLLLPTLVGWPCTVALGREREVHRAPDSSS